MAARACDGALVLVWLHTGQPPTRLIQTLALMEDVGVGQLSVIPHLLEILPPAGHELLH